MGIFSAQNRENGTHPKIDEIFLKHSVQLYIMNIFCHNSASPPFLKANQSELHLWIKDQAKITLWPIWSTSLFTPTDLKVSIVQESMSVSKIVNSRAFRSLSLVHIIQVIL